MVVIFKKSKVQIGFEPNDNIPKLIRNKFIIKC